MNLTLNLKSKQTIDEAKAALRRGLAEGWVSPKEFFQGMQNLMNAQVNLGRRRGRK